MLDFEKISPESLGNAIELIGKQWMLITVSDKIQGKVNAMTASWGALGVLWNKNVCICFVRPERYTYELLETETRFSIAFLGEEHRETLKICGRESGRDTDKLSKCGLTSCELDGAQVIKEAKLVLVCEKLYEDDLKENLFLDKELLKNYTNGGYHRFFVCEIKEAYKGR